MAEWRMLIKYLMTMTRNFILFSFIRIQQWSYLAVTKLAMGAILLEKNYILFSEIN